MKKSKIIFVGGFLGAGKTTLLNCATKILKSRSIKIGVITNDQAEGLVDTNILQHNGLIVSEISGKCFCCDFNGVVDAIDYMIKVLHCELILAEPVGSCTDLCSTLIQPLKKLFPNAFEVAPLSVLVDPLKLFATLKNLDSHKEGSGYIYIKQLEEADYIVVNKIDLLENNQIDELKDLINTKFSDYPICWISSQKSIGVEDWIVVILSDIKSGKRLANVDYDVYALSESRMGWYNASFMIGLENLTIMDWQGFNREILALIQKEFESKKIIIAHVKTFLKSGVNFSAGNIINEIEGVDIRGTEFASRSVRMVINIRAETSHWTIDEIVNDVLQSYMEHGFKFEIIAKKHFTPMRPEPSHRFGIIC